MKSSSEGGYRALPSDPEAEKAVLAAMAISQSALDECMPTLREDDFYIRAHRYIFLAEKALYDAGKPVDAITLADRLRADGRLDAVGGEAYLIELAGNTLSLASWPHHAEILRRDRTLRALSDAAAGIQGMVLGPTPEAKDAVDYAQKRVYDISTDAIEDRTRSVSDVILDVYSDIEQTARRGPGGLGVSLGFPSIDDLTQGLRGGQMVVVGARPGVGKTSFALNAAANAAKAGKTVVFFSLEMSAEEVVQRLLSMESGVTLNKIRGGGMLESDWPPLIEASGTLSALDMYVDDTASTTVTDIRSKARRILGGKTDALVVVDYLQLVTCRAAAAYGDRREAAISEISRSLKIAAKDLCVPVIALSQLNRNVEARLGKRPQLSDLRDSGSIEQDADIVMLLDRSFSDEEAARDYRPAAGTTNCIIAKNRSGSTGEVPLRYYPQLTRFAEMTIIGGGAA